MFFAEREEGVNLASDSDHLDGDVWAVGTVAHVFRNNFFAMVLTSRVGPNSNQRHRFLNFGTATFNCNLLHHKEDTVIIDSWLEL